MVVNLTVESNSITLITCITFSLVRYSAMFRIDGIAWQNYSDTEEGSVMRCLLINVAVGVLMAMTL